MDHIITSFDMQAWYFKDAKPIFWKTAERVWL